LREEVNESPTRPEENFSISNASI